jgi:alkaline phosphatase D
MRDRCHIDQQWERAITRRAFLAGGLLVSGAGVAPVLAAQRRTARARFATSPFSLGVASGDPAPSSVVLWTRLAPEPLNSGGGMPAEPVEVRWRIAHDERLSRIVQQGRTIASPEGAHAVHVEVQGLEPDRWYWYQFSAGGEESPVGRTRTLPAPRAAAERLRFAFASCQNYEMGYFTALRHMAAEDLDLVFHLGDYTYEGQGSNRGPRRHVGGEIVSLDDYRRRYALYKADADLQAAHAACPWVVTWDDHEVDNNYAGAISERDDPRDVFLERRAAAYQAYYDHMPLRARSLPHGADLRLFRDFTYGTLASFFVLDSRQYRSNQPCGDGVQPVCEGVHDPNATMLGPAQEQWLFEGLGYSPSRWNVIPQQVMMAPVDQAPGEGESVSMDQWAGYERARTALLTHIANRRPSNPVVLTGDIHSSWVNDLKVDFDDPRSPTVATEFVGTSITSGGDGVDIPPRMQAVMDENAFVKFYNGQRGYVVCDVSPASLVATYRIVDYVSQPGAPVETRARFVVQNGRPGAQRA